MKINRDSIEFELTEEELVNAYYEQQFNFDKSDATIRIEEIYYDINDPIRKYLIENVESVVEKMRRNIDKYDMDWSYALDEAIECVSLENQ